MTAQRRSYDESVAIVGERVEIVGQPRPTVTRPPRHDDVELGPSIFRTLVEDVSLADLTIPGLFIGRSELRRVSFSGADLHFSTFNWSNLSDCDFSGADLSGADLRACRFLRCRFASTDLSDADLRGSTFEVCSFHGAKMAATRLYRRRRVLGIFKAGADQEALPLSAAQRAEAAWTDEVAEPGGG